MTKIDLITGILGAGKTTFIKEYAKGLVENGEKIAILENDFGAVNVDMMLLQDLASENCFLDMVMGGGDIDCHRRRFKTELISLGMQHFDRVIVEPSGIFDMDEFFDTINEAPLDRWFEVSNVINLVDMELEGDLSDEMEFLLASEAAWAGGFLFTRADLIPEEKREEKKLLIIERLNESLGKINCGRRISSEKVLVKGKEALTKEKLEKIKAFGYKSESYVKKYRLEEIKSQVFYFMNVRIPVEEIDTVINGIFADEECGEVYRIKGAFPLTDSEEECFLEVNATQKRIEKENLRAGQSVLIVIGEKLNREKIDTHFKEKNTNMKYISI